MYTFFLFCLLFILRKKKKKRTMFEVFYSKVKPQQFQEAGTYSSGNSKGRINYFPYFTSLFLFIRTDKNTSNSSKMSKYFYLHNLQHTKVKRSKKSSKKSCSLSYRISCLLKADLLDILSWDF